MLFNILLICIIASFLLFAIPARLKNAFALIVLSMAVGITSIVAINALKGETQVFSVIGFPLLQFDSLSAWFVLIVNFSVILGLIYAGSYLSMYIEKKTVFQFSLHYLAYLWLYFSMILVLSVQNFYSFLFVWEIMSVSSFILVIWDAEDRDTLKAGINYLIQMHIGFLFLTIAFWLISYQSGIDNINEMGDYFSRFDNLPAFLLLFFGFGLKAGLIPLHTWLPKAHPAAPSHVSGIMSGVMIKIGVFGIIRVISFLQSDIYTIGVFILLISLASGLYGVMHAIVQHDLKRLLAYHSIENIGIIGMGMGIGMIGMSMHNNTLIILGFSGALLHVLNHSLFKSALFFNAGGIYQALHTREIDSMGGLIKKMPRSAVVFLVAAAAICGLPPFNGFVSEFLIYSALFTGISSMGVTDTLFFIMTIIGLALIGGLAIFCFVKAFGIVYLGNSRKADLTQVKEPSLILLLPQYLYVTAIIFFGIASFLLIPVLGIIIGQTFGITDFEILFGMMENIMGISVIAGTFIAFSIMLLFIRKVVISKRQVASAQTWGCGYNSADPSLQYTATSFARNYADLAGSIVNRKDETEKLQESDYFPESKSFESHSSDFFDKTVTGKPVEALSWVLKKLSVMQTGQIQHYLLYAFVFMLLIFLLTYLNWI